VEVGEGLGALDRKSALYVTVYVVDWRSCDKPASKKPLNTTSTHEFLGNDQINDNFRVISNDCQCGLSV